MPLDDVHHWYSFLNGTAIATGRAYTLLHAATHRLTHPARFNFTHAQAQRYYHSVLHLDFDYEFVTKPLFGGWASFADFAHVAETTWLTPRTHAAFDSRHLRRQRLEQQGLYLSAPLLDEEDQSEEKQQMRDMR